MVKKRRVQDLRVEAQKLISVHPRIVTPAVHRAAYCVLGTWQTAPLNPHSVITVADRHRHADCGWYCPCVSHDACQKYPKYSR